MIIDGEFELEALTYIIGLFSGNAMHYTIPLIFLHCWDYNFNKQLAVIPESILTSRD